MIRLLFLFSALALHSLPTQASGRTVGNGGDVVICDGVPGRKAVELLDFYEGRTFRGIVPDLGPATLSVSEKIELALKRLDRVSPVRAQRYREHATSFFHEVLFLKDAHLVDIPDSDHIAIPKGCRIEQIANQSPPLYPTDKRYIVDESLWDRLDPDNRAGLILHEIIYRETIEFGQTNSISARFLNSNITSRKIEEMNVEQFTRLLIDLGFPTTSIQGVLVDLTQLSAILQTIPLFYPHGNLKSALAVNGSAWFWENQRMKIRDRVLFFPSGRIQEVTLNEPVSLNILGSPRTLAPYLLTFHETGEIESLTLQVSSRFASNRYDLSLVGAARFHPEGWMALGKVSAGWVQIRSQKTPIEGVVALYPGGRLKSGTLRAPALIPPAQSSHPPLQWHGGIELSDKEEVLNGILAEDQELLLGKRKARFSRWYPISFFPENGRVRRGCLAEEMTFETTDGNRRQVDSRTIVEFLSDGRLAQAGDSC